MILVLSKGVWLRYCLHMCIFDFSIFCLESDFPSAVNAVGCHHPGLKHWFPQLIKLASQGLQLNIYGMAFSSKVSPSQSHSLSGPSASNDYFMWNNNNLDLLTSIRTKLKDYLSPEFSVVSVKAFVGTESQFIVFIFPDISFSFFLTHRGWLQNTSLIKILYVELDFNTV